jgi:hypothetical protein
MTKNEEDLIRGEELWALLRCVDKAANLNMTVKGTLVREEPLAVCGQVAVPGSSTASDSQYKQIGRFRTAFELEAWLDGITFARS